jgi:hypothetical protein
VIIGFIIILAAPAQVFSQERNEEVTITAPFQPSITDALKINFTPEIIPPEKPQYDFQFNYADKQLSVPLLPVPVQPARYHQKKKDNLLRNYIKAGFGNYTTPYLEFFAGSLQSENYQINLRLKHISSQGNIKGYGPSAYSKNEAEVNSKLFFGKHSLATDIDYRRNVYHFYGFEPDSFPTLDVNKDSLRQRFQEIGASTALKSNFRDKEKLSHSISLAFYNYTDRFESRENLIKAKIDLAKGFDLFRNYPPSEIGLTVKMDAFSRKDSSLTSNPLLLDFHPWIDLDFEQYHLQVGFEVVTEHDSSTSVNIFPVILADVLLIPGNLKAFVELKGEREINSFRSLSVENPYIISNPTLLNSISNIGFGGGLLGNAGGFNYYAKALFRNILNMPLYVNDTSLLLLNRFDLIYDDVSEFTLEAGGGYEVPGVIHIALSGIYYSYKMENELQAWHKPAYKVTLSGNYTFLEKYTIDAAIFLFGKAFYKDFRGNEIITGDLPSSLDLNAGFTYQHNRYFSSFLKLNNILNQKYERWHNYPLQGFQVMAGLGFSF